MNPGMCGTWRDYKRLGQQKMINLVHILVYNKSHIRCTDDCHYLKLFRGKYCTHYSYAVIHDNCNYAA